jgi:glycosyltransferase involved in cell wall biosynthesis
MSKLKEAGYPIDWMPHEYARMMAATGNGQITNYDVIVVPRVGDVGDGRMMDLVKLLRAAGRVVIYETDDDYTNEYRKVLDADANGVMDTCTAITVSTPHLREQCAKYTTRPIYLLQNCIDLEWWQTVPKQRRIPSPSIGMIGTTTHYKDWKLAKDALFRISEEYPEAHFAFGGLLPDYYQDLPNLHHMKFVPYTRYPNMVSQIDIGLAPLIGADAFNKSKSAIKAMEYWAAGTCVVASNNSVYNRVVEPSRGFLASTPDEWYTAIRTYLEQPELRKQHVRAGVDWIKRYRDMNTNYQFWWDVYEQVWKEHGGVLDVDFISRWAMGRRPSDGKGSRSNHVLPVSRPRRKRRPRKPHRTNAARGRRRAPSRRST